MLVGASVAVVRGVGLESGAAGLGQRQHGVRPVAVVATAAKVDGRVHYADAAVRGQRVHDRRERDQLARTRDRVAQRGRIRRPSVVHGVPGRGRRDSHQRHRGRHRHRYAHDDDDDKVVVWRRAPAMSSTRLYLGRRVVVIGHRRRSIEKRTDDERILYRKWEKIKRRNDGISLTLSGRRRRQHVNVSMSAKRTALFRGLI